MRAHTWNESIHRRAYALEEITEQIYHLCYVQLYPTNFPFSLLLLNFSTKLWNDLPVNFSFCIDIKWCRQNNVHHPSHPL